jgi:4-hydroxybenzoate polyprenyltransferase
MRVLARFCRLPNLFTAVADPLAGWLMAGAGGPILWPVAASAGLYTAGIVLNDCFDYAADCRDRPERPLPRGEIRLPVAWAIGVGLLAFGVLAGGWNAVPLAVLVLFYNAYSKRSGWLGPLTLGGCRAVNLSLGGPALIWPPLILGGYVVVLALVARREDLRPELRRVVQRLLLGIIVLDALLVFAVTGEAIGALLVLSLLVPAWALGRMLPMT